MINNGRLVGKRISVLGAARSGKAVARLLKDAGALVFVSERERANDAHMAFLHELNITGEFGGHTSRVLEADLIVVSPGVPSSIPILREARDRLIPVVSEVEVAAWFCPSPMVAITGSNGKTTTSSLVAHIFETAGLDYVLAGNIGNAFSEFVPTLNMGTTAILEISSFQLDHIDTFRPRVSLLLNITPDHLDRYDSFDHYVQSKFRIMKNQGAGDAVIYNFDDALVRRGVSSTLDHSAAAGYAFSSQSEVKPGAFIRGDSLVLRTNQSEEVLMARDELALPGRHNLYNSLAAAMAARVMEVRVESIRESLMTFEGVRHRLEFIREVKGVRYVNDSKATNVNAVWYALESMEAPVILIAGGRDKGNDYDAIADLVAEKVRAIVAVGESAERVAAALGSMVDVCVQADSMDDAVGQASRLAQPGDVVLLSPACASFDMFTNYEARGDAFRDAVKML